MRQEMTGCLVVRKERDLHACPEVLPGSDGEQVGDELEVGDRPVQEILRHACSKKLIIEIAECSNAWLALVPAVATGIQGQVCAVSWFEK